MEDVVSMVKHHGLCLEGWPGCPGTVVCSLLAVFLGLEFSLEGAVPRYDPGAMDLLCPPACSPQRSILRGALGDLLQKSPSWWVKVGLCSW